MGPQSNQSICWVHSVDIMKNKDKSVTKVGTQHQALIGKSILRDGSKKSITGYHVTWGKDTVLGMNRTRVPASTRRVLSSLANLPIT